MAKDLGVKPETVVQMEARLSNYDMSFDGAPDDDDENHIAPSTYLADSRSDPAMQLENDDWQNQQLQTLEESLEQLDERSRDILMSRWLDEDNKPTLHDLAAKYNVSAERIRQLEKNAMNKLRASLEA